ncbi:MAG: hypothetical protein ACRCT1_03070 [Microcoleaceae cyanobacterium]
MQFVVCINNQDYSASLEIRKNYQVLPDPKASEETVSTAFHPHTETGFL